jgi:SAM-dependent methyltransferase
MNEDRFAGIVEQYELWRAIDPNYDLSHDYLVNLFLDILARDAHKLLSTVIRCKAPGDDPYPRIQIHILEIGCGVGHTSKCILDADPRIRLMAIDKSPGMVERAKRELASYGDRVRVYLGDALELIPKISSRIDYVVSANTIHNLHPSDQQRLYHLIAGVLEYRGCFFGIDKVAPDDEGLYETLFQEFLGRIEALRETYPVAYAFFRKHEFEDREIRVTESELKVMFTQAGFDAMPLPYFNRYGMVIVSCWRLIRKSKYPPPFWQGSRYGIGFHITEGREIMEW